MQMHEAVERAGVDLIVARRQQGVLAFGSDADLRAAFGPHSITAFDLHTIETKRLRYDSAERGLLREALTHSLAKGSLKHSGEGEAISWHRKSHAT